MRRVFQAVIWFDSERSIFNLKFPAFYDPITAPNIPEDIAFAEVSSKNFVGLMQEGNQLLEYQLRKCIECGGIDNVPGVLSKTTIAKHMRETHPKAYSNFFYFDLGDLVPEGKRRIIVDLNWEIVERAELLGLNLKDVMVAAVEREVRTGAAAKKLINAAEAFGPTVNFE